MIARAPAAIPTALPCAPPDHDAIWPIPIEEISKAGARRLARRLGLHVAQSGSCAFGARRANGRRTAGVTLLRLPLHDVVAPARCTVLDAIRWERHRGTDEQIWAVLLHVHAGYYLILGGFASSICDRDHIAWKPSTREPGELLSPAAGMCGPSLFVQYVAGEGLTPADFRALLDAGELRLYEDREPSPFLRDPTLWLLACAAKELDRAG